MVIRHGQEICLSGFEPALRGAALALRAVSVATRVVGDLRLFARRAPQRTAAQGGAATLFDGRHDLQLAETEVSLLSVSPRRPVGAEDIRDLQAWHEGALLGSGRLQGTQDFAQSLGGDLSIKRCRLQFFVSKQDLDGADVLALLEQVRGE